MFVIQLAQEPQKGKALARGGGLIAARAATQSVAVLLPCVVLLLSLTIPRISNYHTGEAGRRYFERFGMVDREVHAHDFRTKFIAALGPRYLR
jgi:hypothetical protein